MGQLADKVVQSVTKDVVKSETASKDAPDAGSPRRAVGAADI
jgi:hypothetical protein